MSDETNSEAECHSCDDNRLPPPYVNIDIAIMFDVAAISENYPTPSQDPADPTIIRRDLVFMLTEQRNLFFRKTQATADLVLSHALDRPICLFGWTAAQEVGKCAIVYQICHESGTYVVGNPTPLTKTAMAAIPYYDPKTQIVDPMKYVEEKQKRYLIASLLLHEGKEELEIRFLLTERDRRRGDIKTVGYFAWHPSITIRY